MKKFICQVCGYIHEGDDAPEVCPVCDVGKEMFEPFDGETTDSEPAADSAPVTDAGSAGETKWRCRVCNYIHTGSEPPEMCPVCGADKSMFEKVDEAGPVSTEPHKEAARIEVGPLKWRCTVCNYIHAGDSLPDVCPVCGAAADKFETSSPAKAKPSTAEGQSEMDNQPRWKCTVCGYIHTGAEPPDICPVCGANHNAFVLLEEEGDKKESGVDQAGEQKEADEPVKADRWRCTVCGYIHNGPEPPDICPVCGADKSKFEPVLASDTDRDPEELKSGGAAPSKKSGLAPESRQSAASASGGLIRTLMALAGKHHAHPISIHFPNGVLPAAVILYLAFLAADAFRITYLGAPLSLGAASIFNLGLVAASMPLVLLTGLSDWQYKYKGAPTPNFKIKITCGVLVTILSGGLFALAILSPSTVLNSWGWRIFYMGGQLLILGIAAVAGTLGSKLVFKD